jgi:hypothetical protein
MKTRSHAIAFAVALVLGGLMLAGTAAAIDPSADGTRPDYNYRPKGEPKADQGGNDYHANYHADYNSNRGDRPDGRDQGDTRDSRRDSRALPDFDRSAGSPYGWRR